MCQEFEVIELEIDSRYYQAIKTLAQKEHLSAEDYLSMMIDEYLESHGMERKRKAQ